MRNSEFIVRFLGSSGGKSPQNKRQCMCIYLPDNVLIDAGNIFALSEEEIIKIDHILLSHSHLDHIIDVPLLIDYVFETRKKPLKIYGLSETILALKQHIFNDIIWPDFSSISLNGSDKPGVEYIEIRPFEKFNIDNYGFIPVTVSHTVPTVGFIVEKNGKRFFYTSDNYITPQLIDSINQYRIGTVFIDVSFPSSMERVSRLSLHNSTFGLKQLINNLIYTKKIYTVHIKPYYEDVVVQETYDFSSDIRSDVEVVPVLKDEVLNIAF